MNVAFLLGAFLGTGAVTGALIWLLNKVVRPKASIYLANALCLIGACAVYDKGWLAALTVYAVPQIIWLTIFLLARRGKLRDAAATNAPILNVSDTPISASNAHVFTESIPISHAGRRSMTKTKNIVLNHWRGLYSLGVSYWLFGFVISALAVLGETLISYFFASDDGYQPKFIFLAIISTWAFLLALTIWQSVGVWRSADRTFRAKPDAKRGPWAGLAKLLIIVGAIRLAVTFVNSGMPQLQETYQMAFMGDPSIPPYSLRIMRNGTEMEVTSGFKYGLTAEFESLLKASPQISFVHL